METFMIDTTAITKKATLVASRLKSHGIAYIDLPTPGTERLFRARPLHNRRGRVGFAVTIGHNSVSFRHDDHTATQGHRYFVESSALCYAALIDAQIDRWLRNGR